MEKKLKKIYEEFKKKLMTLHDDKKIEQLKIDFLGKKVR